jgi:hypothetical protein
MASEMSLFKAIAEAHMKRDLDAGGKWDCACEACSGIRSLEGMDKMLAVRPILREIEETEHRLHELPEGQEKQGLVELYSNLQDELADKMTK